MFTDKMERKVAEMQWYCLSNKYEYNNLELPSRRNNLHISSIEEEEVKSEEILEAKVIELADDIGIKPDEISVVHCLYKPMLGEKPVIVRLCHRKKKDMNNKKIKKGLWVNERMFI